MIGRALRRVAGRFFCRVARKIGSGVISGVSSRG